MPIRCLTTELVGELVECYGQITKLNLSTNEISRIENLEQLTCLTKLNLFCNLLGRLPGCFDGLARLTRLKELDISDNAITHLEPLSSAAPVSLERLNVANNSVKQVDQVSHLASLTALTELVLSGNPMTSEEGYRRCTLEYLPSLDALDNTPRDHTNSKSADAGDGPTAQPTMQISISDGVVSEKRDDALCSRNPHPLAHTLQGKVDSKFPAPRKKLADGDGTVSERALMSLRESSGYAGIRCGEDRFAEPFTERLEVRPAKSAESSSGEENEDGVNRDAEKQLKQPLRKVEGGLFDPGIGPYLPSTAPEPSAIGNAHKPGLQGDFETFLSLAPSMRPPKEGGRCPLSMTELVATATVPAQRGEAITIQDSSPRFLAESFVAREERMGVNNTVLFSPERSVSALDVRQEAPTDSEFRWLPSQPHRSFLGRHHVHGKNQEVVERGRVDASFSSQTRDGSRQESEFKVIKQSALASRHDELYDDCFFRGAAAGGVVDGAGRASIFPTDHGRRRTSSARVDEGGLKAVSGATNDKPADSNRHHHHAHPDFFVGPSRDCSHTIYQASTRFLTQQQLQQQQEQHGRPTFHGALSSLAGSTNVQQGVHSDADVRSSLVAGRGKETGPESSSSQTRPVLKTGWAEARNDQQSAVGVQQDHQALQVSGGGVRVEVAGGSKSGQLSMVDRKEWENVRRENQELRRQVELADRRCNALMEMQRLADDALSQEYTADLADTPRRTPPFTPDKRHQNSTPVVHANGFKEQPEEHPKERPSDDEDEEEEQKGRKSFKGNGTAVSKILTCWRREVLKLLMQREASVEVGKGESRRAAQELLEERETRVQAETEAKGLTQRALAAEAEAEIMKLKLTRALEDLREDRTRWRAAEASNIGHSVAVHGLQQWVESFVGRASEGCFEREALLARGVAKLEAFSSRMGQAAGRLELLGTLLQHKQIQLRNSRAALVADRRVWLLERRDREMAALSSNLDSMSDSNSNSNSNSNSKCSSNKSQGSGTNADRLSRGQQQNSSGVAWSGHTLEDEDGDGGGGYGGYDDVGGKRRSGRAALAGRKEKPSLSLATPLLEGLRPECEAVMRALFCRVDRLGAGAVRARRLLTVLRSDCGVSELMESAVGKYRWAAALDSMEAELCPRAAATAHGAADTMVVSDGDEGGIMERDVTWGEFLLFFLPSAGLPEQAYNAGLVSFRDGEGFILCNGKKTCFENGFIFDSTAPAEAEVTPGWSFNNANSDNDSLRSRARIAHSTSNSYRHGGHRLNIGFGKVTDEASALLQMVVPPRWTPSEGADDVGRVGCDRIGKRNEESRERKRGGLAALSVGQLRREVLRLAKERAFLLRLVREDGRLGKRRAEAVHDQYRHELRALHSRIREMEFSLKEAVNRADAGEDTTSAVQEDLCRLREEMKQAEDCCQRRLDEAREDKASALSESSRDASNVEAMSSGRIARLEAEHALALRENGKVLVRQRALERELARIKTSMQAEAKLEKESLEERIRIGESKTTVLRRERNALLAALRDIQRRGRTDPNPLPPSMGLEISRNEGRGGEKLRFDRSDANGASTTNVAQSGSKFCSRTSNCTISERIVKPRPFDRVVAMDGAAGMDAVSKSISCGGISRDGREGVEEEKSRETGNGDAGGGGKGAELSARLEALALQTRQLLARDSDSDTSCSSDDDDLDSG